MTILNGPEPDVTIMKHSWLRAPSGFLYCRNCLLVCQWPLVRFDDDCGYQAETGQPKQASGGEKL